MLGVLAKLLQDFGDKVNLKQELVSTFVVITIVIPIYRECHSRLPQVPFPLTVVTTEPYCGCHFDMPGMSFRDTRGIISIYRECHFHTP